MGVRQWVHLLMNVRRAGLTTHPITYRLRSALIRTLPWLQIQRPLQQLPHSQQIGGRLGKRAPNADLWRTQKLRRYEKPLTNRNRNDNPECCMPTQSQPQTQSQTQSQSQSQSQTQSQPPQPPQQQQQPPHATTAIRNSLAMRARKSDLKQPLQVRDALVSRWINYRHLSSKR
ncbi:bromodomain-containing protein DDB_G0280777-like [Drosophila montana]|uniref:bromodomain-containing protein DDB_G0280777-like n=1 Tax=Drosophila montana TaxID=40370 RepID=UPI00313D18CF